MERSILSDETEWIQLGQSVDKDFYKVNVLEPQISAWDVFPTPDSPGSRYKFTSLEVNFSQNLNTIYRQTYSILDWLGDVGGLYDAVLIIIHVATLPFSTFALRTQLLSSLFRLRERQRNEDRRGDSDLK